MAVSFSRRQFAHSLSSNRADKWQSLPVEDSLFPQQSANGSLFQQKTVCSLTFIQQGRQMAVSPSRRQFVSPAVGKWQSLSAEDSLLTFFHDRVDKWQSLPVEDSLFPQQSANGSLFQQKTVCSLSFMTGSTNGSLSQ